MWQVTIWWGLAREGMTRGRLHLLGACSDRGWLGDVYTERLRRNLVSPKVLYWKDYVGGSMNIHSELPVVKKDRPLICVFFKTNNIIVNSFWYQIRIDIKAENLECIFFEWIPFHWSFIGTLFEFCALGKNYNFLGVSSLFYHRCFFSFYFIIAVWG